MNRICPTILAAVALSGCGGPNYTLSGRAGLAPGDTLRLCSPYENDSVLATTVIRRDSSFRIRGHVSEPTIANLMHNDRRIGAPILLEAADIRLEPTGDVRGFQFTGTPLNDAFNAMNAAQVSLGNVLQALETNRTHPSAGGNSTRWDGFTGRFPATRWKPTATTCWAHSSTPAAPMRTRRRPANGSRSSPPNCRTTPCWRAYGARSKPSNARPSAGPTWTSR